MLKALITGLALSTAAPTTAEAPETGQNAADQAESLIGIGAWTARVGGDLMIGFETRMGREGELFFSDGAYTETKLPIGYPTPTPPGPPPPGCLLLNPKSGFL